MRLNRSNFGRQMRRDKERPFSNITIIMAQFGGRVLENKVGFWNKTHTQKKTAYTHKECIPYSIIGKPTRIKPLSTELAEAAVNVPGIVTEVGVICVTQT